MQACALSRRVDKLKRSFEGFWRQFMNDCNFGSRSGIEKGSVATVFSQFRSVLLLGREEEPPHPRHCNLQSCGQPVGDDLALRLGSSDQH